MMKRIIISLCSVVAFALFLQFNSKSTNDIKAFQCNNIESKDTFSANTNSNSAEPRALGSVAKWAGNIIASGVAYDVGKAAVKGGWKRSQESAKKVGKGTGKKRGASAGYSACY
ncbi:hypothetical protein MHZ36_14170 [Staphylococcus sp. ACRSN]|uniref:hypothetical protein n=1 Tax=Staphylococcus sp. ACRSN TaxID=2918214 RepID=UPI001EF1BFD9|nr:hypothetical protein [Staphylococcus sp. ACRSN]MCG7340404.1 hypothetical protein [Staphylococcus sp. ACRSN]